MSGKEKSSKRQLFVNNGSSPSPAKKSYNEKIRKFALFCFYSTSNIFQINLFLLKVVHIYCAYKSRTHACVVR